MWKMPTDIEPILLLLSSACELSQAARPLALIACKHPPVPFREFWGLTQALLPGLSIRRSRFLSLRFVLLLTTLVYFSGSYAS